MGCGVSTNNNHQDAESEESSIDQSVAEVIVSNLNKIKSARNCRNSFLFKSQGGTYCINITQAKTPETSLAFAYNRDSNNNTT
ncbi:unnamed protein product [Blepharisma stoltei]|uniref:Uncharacterized protein n=1 Tax=Blepharisma stoltei TaxID=1481888 RepID=A0AAU9JJW2_9CILI|nr:unnamed protein product [Blepharisma stoltei]